MQRLSIPFVLVILFISLSTPLHALGETISLGGYEWVIKESREPVAPGPNIFSSRSIMQTSEGFELGVSTRSVFGKEQTYSAEMYTKDFFGHGSFELDFHREGRFDSSVVFGFFLYNNDNTPYFSEVDFELARWGIPEANEGQFTVQPYERRENFQTFSVPEGPGDYTVLINWKPDRIDFRLVKRDGTIVSEWSYSGSSLPLMAKGKDVARVHLNFWSFKGMNSVGDGYLSVVVTDFRYREAE